MSVRAIAHPGRAVRWKPPAKEKPPARYMPPAKEKEGEQIKRVLDRESTPLYRLSTNRSRVSEPR
eukprot:5029741-Heterocapsa_arctica.AAC.1